MCVFLVLPTWSIQKVYAFQDEEIVFTYNNKVFTYRLSDNIKHSSQFDLNHNINKYNRFGTKQQRTDLFKHLLSIGLAKDIALEYIFPNLNHKLNSIGKNILIPAKNATVSINSNSEAIFNISKEVIGISLDKEKLFKEISKTYLENKQLRFALPTKITQPEISAADLKKFTNLRATFSTNISNSSADRKHNIKNAMQSLNKIELEPNEVFSFNKVVGKRTIENGYRQAKIIVNNEFIDGVGGGVCQVSSTLYNAALLAGLEIIEANKHSKQVSYVNYGFDAMVNFGSSDLKFKNNTQEKLTIITNFSTNSIRIRIYGESLNDLSYKLYNEIYNIEDPIDEIYSDEKQEYLDQVRYTDEFFYLKKGNKGMEIKTYRETLKNGMVISKQTLRHDKYNVQNYIKIYGIIEREKSTEQTCA